MKNKRKYLNSLLMAAALSMAGAASGVGATETAQDESDFEIVAYYGDKLEDRLVVVDVNNMALKSANATYGADPYPVDKAGDLDKVYAITRGSNSMDVIDSQTFEQIGLVELPHQPRSAEAYNAQMRLQLVTGVDKPMASLIDIDNDTVAASVGEDLVYDANGDYGGSNATGHPFWFSKNKFALIDRPNRVIYVYKVRLKRNGEYKVTELSSVATPTAVHHLVQGDRKRTFFALAEGSAQNNYAPLVIKYKMRRGVLTQVAQTPLALDSVEEMGGHHADMHPDGIHMYIGSTEGKLYVLNTETMTIVKSVEVGQGAGHTTFAPERNLAIITNHKDTFVSVIDTATHSLIKNVTVSGPQQNGTILQSHTSLVSPDMNYFYAFATDNGIFYELDLNTLEVSRTLETGGTPLQGVFLCDGQNCKDM
ncbi:hypothetical protein SG34_018970 [Thalassomonas viridans]|uniref:Uncharacterized protein n=1 Tax=Thalassomonas viridans TaxID=137584 RepID=A0AAF0C796_9GAMM|nr:hypothetical protein [Thalassomonas viridans]WDE03463.1 hypothetical protein SG34_018970 [Thalassomonas viridans]